MSIREKLEARTFSHAQIRWLGVALIALSLIAFTTLAVKARTWLKLETALALTETRDATETSTATPMMAAPPPEERLETELVTITPKGFEPSEITRAQGSFFLEVDNRSGLSEFNIRLDSEHGNRLHQVRVRREQLDWHQKLDLHPGRYVLTEANHPDWHFQLTITAR